MIFIYAALFQPDTNKGVPWKRVLLHDRKQNQNYLISNFIYSILIGIPTILSNQSITLWVNFQYLIQLMLLLQGKIASAWVYQKTGTELPAGWKNPQLFLFPLSHQSNPCRKNALRSLFYRTTQNRQLQSFGSFSHSVHCPRYPHLLLMARS